MAHPYQLARNFKQEVKWLMAHLIYDLSIYQLLIIDNQSKSASFHSPELASRHDFSKSITNNQLPLSTQNRPLARILSFDWLLVIDLESQERPREWVERGSGSEWKEATASHQNSCDLPKSITNHQLIASFHSKLASPQNSDSFHSSPANQ